MNSIAILILTTRFGRSVHVGDYDSLDMTDLDPFVRDSRADLGLVIVQNTIPIEDPFALHEMDFKLREPPCDPKSRWYDLRGDRITTPPKRANRLQTQFRR